MPPEPPHTQVDDTPNEDGIVHQAELDGYQPLSAQATDYLNTFGGSSVSQ